MTDCWGRLYETYHHNSYKASAIDADLVALLADEAVRDKRGIYEYLLGGKSDTQLLDVRLFDEATKKKAYVAQTTTAEASGISNCPLCASGSNANKDRIYKQTEMEADHVAAWSTGGDTSLANCEMLCIPHNRAKGNR